MLGKRLSFVKQAALGSHKYVEEIVGCRPNKHRPLVRTRRVGQIESLDRMHRLFETIPSRTERAKCRGLNLAFNLRNACPYSGVDYRETETLEHRSAAVTPPLPQRSCR